MSDWREGNRRHLSWPAVEGPWHRAMSGITRPFSTQHIGGRKMTVKAPFRDSRLPNFVESVDQELRWERQTRDASAQRRIDRSHRQSLQGGRSEPRTYASVVKTTRGSRPFFPDIPLKGRQVQEKEGAPLIIFGKHELDTAFQTMAFALVIKFSPVRPRVGEISDHIQRVWRMETRPYVGALDGKHALVICGSERDAVEGLTCESRRMGSAFFRIFRWSPEFSLNAEPTSAATWVRLHGLDPCFFRSSLLKEIFRGFGRFLKVDEPTLSLANPAMARVCVEVDMARPLVQGIWVGSESRQKWVEVDYEGRLDYCGRCKRHGHTRADCRKTQNDRKPRREISNQPGANSGESLSAVQGVNDQKEARWIVVRRKKKGTQSRQTQIPKKRAEGQQPYLSEQNDSRPQVLAQSRQDDGAKKGQPMQPPMHSAMPETVKATGIVMKETGAGGTGSEQKECVSGPQFQQLTKPRIPVYNLAIQSPFLCRMQDNIEDCVTRLFEQEKQRAQRTVYRRTLSVDDSAIGYSSGEAKLAHIEELTEEPFQICFGPDWGGDSESSAERVARLRRERDQCRRTTRSAIKPINSHASK
uniref:DUF4283 domain-containing protein n=1 Tax=Kalanchoe fedtschenkoi TaxID=63787 RepID=A0A7N0TJN7_KALFE